MMYPAGIAEVGFFQSQMFGLHHFVLAGHLHHIDLKYIQFHIKRVKLL